MRALGPGGGTTPRANDSLRARALALRSVCESADVEEADAAQVEDHAVGAGVDRLIEQPLDVVDGAEVELAGDTQQHGCRAMLDLDADGLANRLHADSGAAFDDRPAAATAVEERVMAGLPIGGWKRPEVR